SERYDLQNQQMHNAGKNDNAIGLALATRIKRKANVMKNYRGKLRGLRNIDLVKEKRQEDEALAQFIASRPDLKTAYGTLMQDIDMHYKQVFQDAEKELWFNNLYSGIRSMQIAHIIGTFQEAIAQQSTPGLQKQLFDYNIAAVKKQLEKIYESYHTTVDQNIGKHLFALAYNFKGENTIATIQKKGFSDSNAAETFIFQAIDGSKLKDKNKLFADVLNSVSALLAYRDDLLNLQQQFAAESKNFDTELTRREGVLNKLMADYVAVKEIYQSKNFIPDANATLRLTFGYIKGYSPADATYMSPFTSIGGLIEK